MKLKTIEVKVESFDLDNRDVCNPKTAFRCLEELQHADREEMWILHLNSQSKLISKEMVSKGGLTQGTVFVKEIFRGAILQCAQSIVLAHNHPGNSIEFSVADIETAKRTIEAGYIVGILLCDFLSIGTDCGYSSLREQQPKLFERK